MQFTYIERLTFSQSKCQFISEKVEEALLEIPFRLSLWFYEPVTEIHQITHRLSELSQRNYLFTDLCLGP